MSIFKHAMQPGGIEEPPEGLSEKEKAEWFCDTFDDLPDGAFFALAEEMDIDLIGDE